MNEVRFNSSKNCRLSNFYRQPGLITIPFPNQPSISFDSVEAAFHPFKQSPRNRHLFEEFSRYDPPQARSQGKRIPFLRKDWDTHRITVMQWLLKQKFQDALLKETLIATGTDALVHEAPWDEFWGTGRAHTGQNVLGRLLEDLRKELI